MHSPRSTWGTTRHSAYWNSSRGAGTLGLLGEVARRLEAASQVLGVAVALAVEPVGRDGADPGPQQVVGHPRRRALVGLGDRARRRQQHVLGDRRERAAGLGRQVAVLVLQV